MKKVVIIGGGFAGSSAAKILKDKCDLTLIDTEDFFEYTPGILRVLVEPKHYKKLIIKHKEHFPNVKIIIGHVDNIDDESVILKDGKKINYDYLLISSGSRYNSPIKEEDVYYATRIKHLLEANKKIENSKKIIIVGGGVVGVELAAELATHYRDKKITLIHSKERLMERNNIKTSDYAKNFLEKKGVEIILNERIIKNNSKNLISESGKKYPYNNVFFTVGIQPNIEFMKHDFSKYLDKGITVNSYLQIPNKENIFIAGDVTNIIEEKTAQNAEMHGKIAAKNIISLINGKDMTPYRTKKRLMVISLGNKNGIIEYNNFVLTGWIPALLKVLIEKMVMNGFR